MTITDFPIETTALSTIFLDAHTHNSFAPGEITDDDLRAVYDVVKWGPTSMNIQPLRVVALRSPESRARLVKHMGGANPPKTLAAPLTLIMAADYDFHENLPTQFPANPGAKDMFAAMDDRHYPANLSATLQIAYWIVGLRAAGFAAGPMTGFDNAAVDAEFFSGTHEHALVVVNVGRPNEDGFYPRSPRLDADQVITEL